MTEKQYGGSTGRGTGEKSTKVKHIKPIMKVNDKKKEPEKIRKSSKETSEDKILEAGKIAKKVREWIIPQIKKGMPLLEIANKIEDKIEEMGGKPAFPCNLSINEIAAHYTPSYNDETKAHGLIKVDFGAHIDGWCSDQSLSIDLENSEENKKLIESANEALKKAIEKISKDVETGEIGKVIQETIEEKGFLSIVNLSGHEIAQYDLHAGLTIPNFNDRSNTKISEGLYAIEPFSTNGNGKVRDGKPSGIYYLIDPKNVRSPIAREVLEYILDEYGNLPFCSRWLVKKFGTKALFGLKQLEQNNNIYQFPQLIESGNGIVAQAEHTILIGKDKKIVTTK